MKPDQEIKDLITDISEKTSGLRMRTYFFRLALKDALEELKSISDDIDKIIVNVCRKIKG